MDLPILSDQDILAFMCVFLRIGAMLIFIPVIGETSVPARVKIGLAVLISLLVFPSLRTQMTSVHIGDNIMSATLAIAGEIWIGTLIGFTARIIFAGIQFAGELMGIQMGFSILNVIDPLSSTQVSIISEFQYLIALLVYLAIDAHHIFIITIVESYHSIAPLGFHFSGSLMQSLLVFSGGLFTTAVKISAPVTAVMLFTNIALGIIARTVPQINVFVIGFPLQIAAGMTVFGLTAPIFLSFVQKAIFGLTGEIHTLLRLM